ncbi:MULTISPECIES: hypothetical protein [Myroides]|uniref:hypothetical protein n=1 Tax=Myroides TaxID=76831 RepID=UPI001E3FD3E5|nr:hypothetical protein [Myroides phaeus]
MMYTLLFGIAALSFFMLYNSSKKVKFNKRCPFTDWLRENKILSKRIAYSLLVITLLTEIAYEGIGVGSLTFILYLMFIGSAVVAIYPTISMKYTQVLSLIGVCLLFEFILF